MNLGLGGYAASAELFTFIIQNVPWGKTILELGSGSGTKLLSRFYDIHSIEHDEQYVGNAKNAEYIHAPLTPHEHPQFPHHKQWYDVQVVEEAIIDLSYDVLIVDGPTGFIGRSGFLTHIDLFKIRDCLILLDDVHRADEFQIFMEMQLAFHNDPAYYSMMLPGTNGKRFAAMWFTKGQPFSLHTPR